MIVSPPPRRILPLIWALALVTNAESASAEAAVSNAESVRAEAVVPNAESARAEAAVSNSVAVVPNQHMRKLTPSKVDDDHKLVEERFLPPLAAAEAAEHEL
ncbi:uncharacterized protein PHALS_04575 [Plasmopara halstedii]|uniref:RxLR-like protein n=1 Tax=Plasmopara halstedii TaxID=4781 RepID=A0A0P1A956_PLAHL|nr:uncharacterized protein PHALS_04575 [Plasmopara halstedii]CEG37122.1 hypothetical protein PHALS_04575 [Plasmopara halstedii]|eukprot:XP_024573491.1 hypothetical protein PHALS_04575 [Plasmopara halstedii]